MFDFLLQKSRSRAGKAEHCQRRLLWTLNKTASNTESRFWKRFCEGHFPHLHQIDFYLSQQSRSPIRVENYFVLLRNAVIITAWNNRSVPKIPLCTVTKVLLFELQRLYDKGTLNKARHQHQLWRSPSQLPGGGVWTLTWESKTSQEKQFLRFIHEEDHPPSPFPMQVPPHHHHCQLNV